MQELTPSLVLKNLLFTAVAPGMVAVAGPLYFRGPIRSDLVALTASFVFFFVGASVYFSCLWDFATFGRGTPAPIDPPKRLIVHGLYRYTRNPMYVGVLTVITGWLILAPSSALTVYLPSVWLAFHLFVVVYEEPRLHELFGEEYVEYRRSVSRWVFLRRGSR